MNPRFPFRPVLFVALLPLAALGTATAQTPTPVATTTPAAKPPVETSAPSPRAAVTAATPADKTPPVRKDIFDKYDTNHNGVLDPDELAAYEKDRAARKAERLAKYDKNHDGRLDESEVAAMRADREKEKAKAEKAKASPIP